MANSEYWRNRSVVMENRRFADTLSFEEEMDKIIQREVALMEKELQEFLLKYAKDNKITYQQALKKLTKIEMKEYSNKITSLIETARKNASERTLAEIRTIQARKKVTRMQSLIDYLNLKKANLSDTEAELIEKHLSTQYENQYTESLFELQKMSGSYSPFDIPSGAALTEIVNYPYSGLLFSENIWKANDKMVTDLVRTLQNGMVQGKGIDKMTRELKKALQDSTGTKYRNFDIRRIIRTESAFIQEQANTNSMKEFGTKEYEIVTAPDERRCKRCAAMDGKKFALEEEMIGVNAPPFHAQCRCTKIANVLTGEDREFIETFKTARDLGYQEWKEKYGKKGKN